MRYKLGHVDGGDHPRGGEKPHMHDGHRRTDARGPLTRSNGWRPRGCNFGSVGGGSALSIRKRLDTHENR
jgi:hypothetical protein